MLETITKTWRIEDQDGNVWLEEDGYTAALAIGVCTILMRDEWEVVDPTRSPFAFIALLAILFSQRYGCSVEDAQLLVMMQRMDDLLSMLRFD